MSLLDDWTNSTQAPSAAVGDHHRPDELRAAYGGLFADEESSVNPFASDAASPSSTRPGTFERGLSVSSWGGDLDDANKKSDPKSDLKSDPKSNLKSENLKSSSPTFSLKTLDWKSTLKKSQGFGLDHQQRITSLAASAGTLVIATSDHRLLRWNLDSSPEPDDVALRGGSQTESSAVHKVFLDPTGSHTIVTMDNGDNFYAHATSRKARVLHKLRGITIESVAWNKIAVTEMSTKSLLIGSVGGTIYELVVEASKERVFKEVYRLKDKIPICGLQFEQFPTLPSDPPKFFVMAATARPTRYYQFVGGPSFEDLFAGYKIPDQEAFIELPSQLNYSELHFFTKYLEERANSFALLTEVGVYHGNLQFGSQGTGDKVITDYALLPYPEHSLSGADMKREAPVSMAETEFHFLLLYADRLLVVNKLSSGLAFEEEIFADSSSCLGLIRDASHNIIWLHAGSGIFQVMVTDEDKDVWRLYLAKAQQGDPVEFETALKYCKTESQRNEVLNLQADHYFREGKFELAAKYYAETTRSFEEVTLMLLDSNQADALKSYLLLRLNSLPPDAKTQTTILCAWLVEIFLKKLNDLRDVVETEAKAKRVDNVRLAESDEAALRDEFEGFLRERKAALDPLRATVFDLMSSHGRVGELLTYARIIEDHERVITHHMQRGEYARAVDTLAEAAEESASRRAGRRPSPEIEELYYKHAAVLMNQSPERTVDAWIDAPFLNPCKLIPALVQYSERVKKDRLLRVVGGGENHAVRYLEHCVKENGNQDPAIHNYLLSLYAEDEDDAELREFLASPGCSFDLKYALRVCAQRERTHACVLIYQMMGLFEEAVDLALKVGVELAKECATKASDEAARKRLWLKIARHSIDASKDVKSAIALLRETDSLKIEDILPHFPDFVVIDDFLKSEVCSSLNEYNGSINALVGEMEEFTENAKLIRADIDAQGHQHENLTGSQTCGLCGSKILDGRRDFYVFPCTHAFHCGCLLDEVARHLNEKGLEKVETLRKLLTASDAAAESAKWQSELDEMVASSCPFCGDLMISSIGEPLISAADDAEARLWDL